MNRVKRARFKNLQRLRVFVFSFFEIDGWELCGEFFDIFGQLCEFWLFFGFECGVEVFEFGVFRFGFDVLRDFDVANDEFGDLFKIFFGEIM